jgi:predicted DNA-binding transcriptional regulator AlpA
MSALPLPRLLYSVKEFCSAAGISKAHFYRLRQQGIGPELVRIGDATRISVEAAHAWITRLEEASRHTPLTPRGRHGKRAPTLADVLTRRA